MSYPDSNQLQKFFRKKQGEKIVVMQQGDIYIFRKNNRNYGSCVPCQRRNLKEGENSV